MCAFPSFAKSRECGCGHEMYRPYSGSFSPYKIFMVPFPQFSLLVIEKFNSSLSPHYTIYNAYTNYYITDLPLSQQLSPRGK